MTKAKELQRKIDKANKRIKRLNENNLKPLILVQALNTLGAEKFSVKGKSAEERAKIEIILDRFLTSKLSTVKAARTADERQREIFNDLITKGLTEINAETLNTAYNYFGDTDFRQLMKEWTYEEVRAAIATLNKVGADINKQSVDRALFESISAVVERELIERGVVLTGDELTDYVQMGIDYGIDYAVSVWYNDTME